MRQLMMVGALGTLIAAAPGRVAAQAGEQGCAALLKAPAAGGWAEFRLERAGVQDMRVRFAIVGAERRGEQALVWFETRAEGLQQGGTQVTQVLVPGYPYASGQIVDFVAKRDSQTAVRLGPRPLARARTQKSKLLAAVADGCRGATLVGEETTKVPAGSFRTRHYRDAAGTTDLWIDPSRPFGVVRMVNRADRTLLELRATGSDARSSITEKPAVFPGN